MTAEPVSMPLQDPGRVVYMTDSRQDVKKTGARFARKRQERDEARDALRAAVVAAVADGVSEVEVSELAGVDRMTVRSWLGKLNRSVDKSSD